jgi:hypothetical protein
MELCKSSGGKIDRPKTERIQVQQTVIDLQQSQLQQVKETVDSSVQKSVKTEMTTLHGAILFRKTLSQQPHRLKVSIRQ